MQKEFSVSMCVYNGDSAEHFDEALTSVFNQTVIPDEVVLVVDGPVNDGINDVISRFENNSIFKVIRLEKNVGHGNARRIGLQNCKNELVALMDADDICACDRFEEQLSVFENDKEVDVVGGIIEEFIGDKTNIIGKRSVPSDDCQIKEYIKYRCPFNQMTVMFKKQAVVDAGGYLDWYCDEDYYLWLRMMLNGAKFYNLSKTLVYVRCGIEMYKRRGGVRYFKSEAKLQKYMLENGVIDLPVYLKNVMMRLILQVIVPPGIRGWLFKNFAREKAN
ncbi:MAG: glycosyltransferase [Eubacteriales bacterium]|nr:glycosyltransferase [Eubacteriales bacterium]